MSNCLAGLFGDRHLLKHRGFDRWILALVLYPAVGGALRRRH